MQLDLKTQDFTPRRQTYSHLARRFGEDRPASRYEEATYDIQADVHFHYRPTWDPDHKIFDPARTKVEMEDWYKLVDPRQYYYATYNIARAKMYEASDRNFDFIEKAGLLATADDGWVETVKATLVPLRHYEWGANMVNSGICAYGYGTAVTQAASFAMADRLGLAQLVSRIGLTLSGNDPSVLDAGKTAWTEGPMWQDLRRLVEDVIVIDDWFEALVAQNMAMDAVVHEVVYGGLLTEGAKHGGQIISMMTEFVNTWRPDFARWVDAVVKTAAAESDANKQVIAGWVKTYGDRAAEAVGPVAEFALGAEGGRDAVAQAREALDARAAKLGLV